MMPGRPRRLQAGLERSATCGTARRRGRRCSCCYSAGGETDSRAAGLSEAQALGYRRGTVQIVKHRPLPTNCGRHRIQKSPFFLLFAVSTAIRFPPPPSSRLPSSSPETLSKLSKLLLLLRIPKRTASKNADLTTSLTFLPSPTKQTNKQTKILKTHTKQQKTKTGKQTRQKKNRTPGHAPFQNSEESSAAAAAVTSQKNESRRSKAFLGAILISSHKKTG